MRERFLSYAKARAELAASDRPDAQKARIGRAIDKAERKAREKRGRQRALAAAKAEHAERRAANAALKQAFIASLAQEDEHHV